MTTVNPSLQKKSAARMAAVQCLYRMAMNKQSEVPAAQVAALKKQLAGNKQEQKLLSGAPIEPNYTLLEAILSGATEHRDAIDTRMEAALSKDWKRERVSPLLIAIFQCAIFELFFYKDAAPKIIIDEYTRLARSFFGDGEVNFVFGALTTLSKKYNG